jgi:integrase
LSPVGYKYSDRIFDCTPDQVSVAFKRTIDDVKIENFRFHDLRHTAASWMRMSGADTQRLLNCSVILIRGWRRATSI